MRRASGVDGPRSSEFTIALALSVLPTTGTQVIVAKNARTCITHCVDEGDGFALVRGRIAAQILKSPANLGNAPIRENLHRRSQIKRSTTTTLFPTQPRLPGWRRRLPA